MLLRKQVRVFVATEDMGMEHPIINVLRDNIDVRLAAFDEVSSGFFCILGSLGRLISGKEEEYYLPGKRKDLNKKWAKIPSIKLVETHTQVPNALKAACYINGQETNRSTDTGPTRDLAFHGKKCTRTARSNSGGDWSDAASDDVNYDDI